MSGESIRPGSKLKAIILIGVAFHPVIGFINTSAANIIAWFDRYREELVREYGLSHSNA